MENKKINKYNLDKLDINNHTEVAKVIGEMTDEFVEWYDYHHCWTPLHNLEREFSETFDIDQNVVHILVTGLIRRARKESKLIIEALENYKFKMKEDIRGSFANSDDEEKYKMKLEKINDLINKIGK